MQKHGFLIDLLRRFSDRHIFFLVWALVAAFFVWLMLSYLRKTTRPNFKRESKDLTAKRGTLSIALREENKGVPASSVEQRRPPDN